MNKWDVPDETDFTERMATVYLFKRPIQNSHSSGMNVNVEIVSHWILVFEFEGGDWRTAEGTPTDDGKLVPKYEKQRPRGFIYANKLGRVKMSPSRLRQYVLDNRHNGTEYNRLINNCQEWVGCLCKSFTFSEVPEKVKSHTTAFDLSVITTGVAAVGTAVYVTLRFLNSLFGPR